MKKVKYKLKDLENQFYVKLFNLQIVFVIHYLKVFHCILFNQIFLIMNNIF